MNETVQLFFPSFYVLFRTWHEGPSPEYWREGFALLNALRRKYDGAHARRQGEQKSIHAPLAQPVCRQLSVSCNRSMRQNTTHCRPSGHVL